MLDGAIDHPANAGLRSYLEPRLRSGFPSVVHPDQIERPYDSLGTHPDLVTRLWDELPAKLPVDCRIVFFGSPALIHPTTKIVFGFAGGTHTYALRLPERERAAALQTGATRVMRYAGKQPALDLSAIGDAWVFGQWFRDEEAWCRAAFDFAASGS